MFIIFCSYGLGMWYGAREVARDIRRDCVGDGCKTGGAVLTVFWAILQGAMVRLHLHHEYSVYLYIRCDCLHRTSNSSSINTSK